MVRRRSPKPADCTIPAGWTAHDGSAMPVHAESRPAVLFRSGSRMQIGSFPARHWRDFDQDCWRWQGRAPDRFDIIAFRDEPDQYVAVTRLA